MGHVGVSNELAGERALRRPAGQYDVVARVRPPLREQLTSETGFQVVHRCDDALESLFFF